ncbi:MAG TPA: hypothetical protein VHB73_05845 [Alphaproteobacteria bacterium]|nr:hypothetical protein [Alphaproteobacteria bacterium]
MPPEVATWLLAQVDDRLSQVRNQYRSQGRQYDIGPAQQTMIQLLRAGANPYFLISPPYTSAESLESYLRHSPFDAKKDQKGHTLGHAHCLTDDFLDKKLPVLRKYGLDINSVSGLSPIGTLTHVMLANEHIEETLAFLQATKGKLDPTKRDGQKKTIPIIAAKVRAEPVLLALADLYPQNLALHAQDEQGCSVLHYCFGLGLAEAVRRYADLGARLDLPDNKGRTPVDYLDLPAEDVGEILRSIEIHPGRDAGAWRNAILGQLTNEAVLIEDKPVLARAENFTPEISNAALAQFGEAGVQLVAQQKQAMQGVSVLEEVINRRAGLKREYEAGLIVPSPAKDKKKGAQPASSEGPA